MVRMALNLLIVLVPIQMVVGDLQGTNTGKYQPAKLAAIEGATTRCIRSLSRCSASPTTRPAPCATPSRSLFWDRRMVGIPLIAGHCVFP